MARMTWFFRWLLSGRHIPHMSRPTFRYDVISGVLVAIGAAPLLQSFTQLFARKALQAQPWVVALLLAELAVGNLLATFLVNYLQRRRRVPLLAGSRLLIAAVMLALAALPVDPRSAYLYAALLMLPALLMSVALSVQTSIWQTNYPDQVRGRIFSRVFILKAAATAVSVKLACVALDAWPWAHHAVYAVGAAAMAGGAIVCSRIRVRREKGLLRESARTPIQLLAGFRLLRQDPAYGWFMFWQMLSGGAVLLSGTVLILVLTDRLHVDYSQGATALALVPLGVAIVAAPLSGHLFDAIGIARFRALGAALWASGRALIYAGVLAGSWPLVLAAFALQGLGMATGDVAYNLGHTRFAPAHRGQTYMGIHMTLQGVRGIALPFLGVWLYHWPAVGLHLLIAAAILQLIAAGGFYALKPLKTESRQEAG